MKKNDIVKLLQEYFLNNYLIILIIKKEDNWPKRRYDYTHILDIKKIIIAIIIATI